MAIGNNPFFSCFIVVLQRTPGIVVDTIIPFQFMPKNITDSKAAVYQDLVTYARSSPYKSYSNSGARQISLTLEYFAAPEQGLRIIDPIIIKNRIDAIRSIAYPTYRAFTIKPPPRCLIIIGMQMAFLGVCKSVNVNYSGESPWGTLPLVLAHHATVSLTFEEALKIPLSSGDVRMGLPASSRGEFF